MKRRKVCRCLVRPLCCYRWSHPRFAKQPYDVLNRVLSTARTRAKTAATGTGLPRAGRANLWSKSILFFQVQSEQVRVLDLRRMTPTKSLLASSRITQIEIEDGNVRLYGSQSMESYNAETLKRIESTSRRFFRHRSKAVPPLLRRGIIEDGVYKLKEGGRPQLVIDTRPLTYVGHISTELMDGRFLPKLRIAEGSSGNTRSRTGANMMSNHQSAMLGQPHLVTRVLGAGRTTGGVQVVLTSSEDESITSSNVNAKRRLHLQFFDANGNRTAKWLIASVPKTTDPTLPQIATRGAWAICLCQPSESHLPN